MKSWKTTVSAIVTAIFGFILFAPEYFQSVPWLISLAKFGAAGGLIWFGLSAKDNNVTGGTKPTSVEAKERVDSPKLK